MNEYWPDDLNVHNFPAAPAQNATPPTLVESESMHTVRPNTYAPGVLQRLRKTIVFTHWLAIAPIVWMVCVFLNLFVFEFLQHLWRFLLKNWFGVDW